MKHHFIPRFLLKAWADTTKDGKVEAFRLDLKHLPSSRMSPKHTGYEDNLYALTESVVASVEQQAVEKRFLQRIDSDGAGVLRKLNATGFGDVEPHDASSWACFIRSLLLRSPEVASWLRSKAPDVLRASLDERPEEYDSIAESLDPTTLSAFVDSKWPNYTNNYGMMSLGSLICNQQSVRKLLDMKWWLLEFSNHRHHLLLADRPCIVATDIDDPEFVALPISPWKAFVATKTDRVARDIMYQRPKDLLRQINESSLNQAKQRIYARDASQGRFISNRLAKRKLYAPQ